MLLHDQVVAKYNPEQNEVEIFNVEGMGSENSDMICLANMLNELVDEMIRRGYDPETIVFSMRQAVERFDGDPALNKLSPSPHTDYFIPPHPRRAAGCPAGTAPAS